MRVCAWMIAFALMGCGRSDEGLDELSELGGVYGVPNIDDDDDDGTRDWRDDDVDGENDLATLDLSEVVKRMRKRDRLQLVLSGDDSDGVRVWAGDQLLLGEDFPSIELERDSAPEAVQVEFKDFLLQAELTIVHLKSERTMLGLVERSDSRAAFEQVTLDLVSAPLILNHHLQPAESAYIVAGEGSFYGYSYDNLAMVDAIDQSIGDRLVFDDLTSYAFDVWVQDEFETATLTSPDSRLDVVIDSIRDRGLDDFPESVVADGPDTVVRTWGSGVVPTSQDSFGNLEVSPPVTVDGVHYPFGRIYWGRWGNDSLVPALAGFLRSQKVQDPFTLDVSFLLVGHVDEFTTFLPDSSAPKGFRLYVADTDLGFAFLDGLPASTGIDSRYGYDHGYPTVADMIAEDDPLRELNEDYQRDFIEPAIAKMKRELGLDDEDIVRVPGIFEEVGGPYTAALIPGAVNMLVTTNPDGTATAFLPDPFFRDDGAPQSEDPYIAAFEALLPADVEPVWVDDWEVYHIALGEVHCGTNTTRTPAASWWEDAMHLIQDGD